MRFPSEILTPRTRLRAWQPGDAPALKVALDENKHHLLPWIPWATGQDTPPGEVEQRVASVVAGFEGGRHGICGIGARDGSQIRGGTGLHSRVAGGGRWGGYWLA